MSHNRNHAPKNSYLIDFNKFKLADGAPLRDKTQYKHSQIILEYFITHLLKVGLWKTRGEVAYPYPKLTKKMKSIFKAEGIPLCDSIQLSRDIDWWPSKDGKSVRGGIYGKPCGKKGGFKIPVEVNKVLYFNEGKIERIAEKKYIALDFFSNLPNLANSIKHSQEALHLGVKPTPYPKAIVMKRFRGKELFSIINDELHGVTLPLSLELRLQLSIQILQAWEREVYDNNLLHRDIKPENIFVLLDESRQHVLSCHFIDFDFAMNQSENDHSHCGSLFYVAPEVEVNGESSLASEAFSMGETLRALWDFDELDNIDNDTRDEIKWILGKMTQFDPSKRLSIFEAHKFFEECRLTKKLISMSQRQRTVVANAYELALDVNMAMHEAIRKAYEAVSLANEKALHANEKINPATYEKLHDLHTLYDPIIQLILSPKLANQPAAIEEFIEVLGIPELENTHSKEEIAEKLNHIIDSYEERLTQLRNLLVEIKPYQNHQGVETLCQAIETLIKRSENHHHGIDNLVLFTEKFEKMLKKGTEQWEKIKQESQRNVEPSLASSLNVTLFADKNVGVARSEQAMKNLVLK